MASPPAASSSSSSFMDFALSDIVMALEEGDLFLCTRPKRTNQRIRQVSKTCYTGSSEQDFAKDGKQDISPSPDDELSNKHSHECILQMNTGAVPPPRTSSVFILDSRATSHVVGDESLFSPSFRSRTTTYHYSSAAASSSSSYQADDGRILTVAGVGTVVSCDNLRIPNVRGVHDLCTTGLNLVSVQQLAECGYLVEFGGGQCSVMEQSSSKIVGKGRLHADDGLYYLEFLNIPHDDKECEGSTKT